MKYYGPTLSFVDSIRTDRHLIILVGFEVDVGLATGFRVGLSLLLLVGFCVVGFGVGGVGAIVGEAVGEEVGGEHVGLDVVGFLVDLACNLRESRFDFGTESLRSNPLFIRRCVLNVVIT